MPGLATPELAEALAELRDAAAGVRSVLTCTVPLLTPESVLSLLTARREGWSSAWPTATR